MKHVFLFSSALFVIYTFAFAAFAGPPHQGGLPPGLQKKVERGASLPPGWRKKSGVYEYGYEDPYYDQFEPEYPEDKVVRIIKDVRDLTNSVSQ